MNPKAPTFALALATLAACRREPEPQRSPAIAGPELADPRGGLRFSGTIGFSDGTRVDDIVVEPATLEPGQPLRVGFAHAGPRASGHVIVSPPRTGGRQLAQGGVDAARAPAPVPDIRVRRRPFSGDGSRVEVELDLPKSWHAETAMITLELDGSARARQGPRTAAGAGVLALVPVRTRPTTTVAMRTQDPIDIDGQLVEALWRAATATELVHSLDGEPVHEARTEVWFGWDDDFLYVAARLWDDDIWSEYREQDDPLWKQEVFELFVFGDAGESVDDPDIRRDYLELQLSPRGLTFDARFPQYREGDEAWDSAWRTAVDLAGDLDARGGRDEGWSLEAAIPWVEICTHTSARCPPQAGSRIRLNTFRLERPRKGAPIGLSLSPTRVPDFHSPHNAAIVELAS